MIGARNVNTKKSLKEKVGKSFLPYYVETSMFGNEYPADGNGRITMVGPCAHTSRKWYATVTVKDNIIVSVK